MADPSIELWTDEIQGIRERQPILRQGLAHNDGMGGGGFQNNNHGQTSFDAAQDRHWVGVGKLTPGLIHEINNTLCAIGNYLQLLMLERERRGWDILKPLQAMSNSLERAQALTQQVAVYAREPARPQSRLRVHDLLEAAVALAHLHRAFRGLHLRRAFADNLPEIEGDPRSLMDAFLELLTVAASALGQGGTLAISTESTADWVVVSFSGVGQWPQCSDDSLTFARQIVEYQEGRIVREVQPGSTEGQLSVWLRTGRQEGLGGRGA